MNSFAIRTLTIVAALILAALPNPVRAMTQDQESRFEVILNMNVDQLTTAARQLLADKFPNENWDRYHFPAYVFTNAGVETGYKIAVMEPALLGMANVADEEVVIPCYCFCDTMGHANLLACFYQGGDTQAGFDIHAAGCKICYSQAMQAFLWNDLGATHDEIITGMKRKYWKLIEMKKEGKF